MTFSEQVKSIKEKLKGMLTADNTELITGLDSDIDALSAEYDKRGKYISDLQETVVNTVKKTGFKTPADDDPADGGTKSIDEIIAEATEKILKKE